jgi:hypothetical protein
MESLISEKGMGTYRSKASRSAISSPTGMFGIPAARAAARSSRIDKRRSIARPRLSYTVTARPDIEDVGPETLGLRGVVGRITAGLYEDLGGRTKSGLSTFKFTRY